MGLVYLLTLVKQAEESPVLVYTVNKSFLAEDDLIMLNKTKRKRQKSKVEA